MHRKRVAQHRIALLEDIVLAVYGKAHLPLEHKIHLEAMLIM
jgi:hypothetical protein